MNWWLNATFSKSPKDDQTKDTTKMTDEGDYENLKGAQFEPYTMDSTEPYKSRHQDYYNYEKSYYQE